MDEKKAMKISLSTFFLIVAIIVIIVMGIFMFILYNEKLEANKKAEALQEQVNTLQGKINTISETINSNSSSTGSSSTNSNNKQFTTEQVKNALSNYLELKANANCDGLLETLTKKGKLNYDSSKNSVKDDGTVTTNIKFSDYKTAMLNYVSESEFEKNWTSSIHINKDSNGYLTKTQGGGSLRIYSITNIQNNGNSSYLAKTSSTVENDKDTKEDKDFTFTVKLYNGNCVIDSIK